jgi:soluble lytic murein transglycosylase-like protein
MQIISVLLGLALSLVSASAQANIYGYVDEQGIAHLATEKVDARYKLFARGDALHPSSSPAISAERRELLRHLTRHPNLKKFEPLLKAAGNEFAVDAALLKAVMAAESGFDPDATSPKGAIGLMQVMPTTAERYGLRGDNQKTLEEKLSDPKTNIRLGARYLRDLQRMFPDQQDLVLASYNAGEGAVQKYNNTIPPYPETLNYVELVTQIYQWYQPRAATPSLKTKVFSTGVKSKRLSMTIPATSTRESKLD